MVSRVKCRTDVLFFSITALFALILFIRTVVLIVKAPDTVGRDYNNPVVSPQVIRGTITDRNGRILAVETPYYSCALALNFVKDLEKTAEILAPAIGMEVGNIIDTTKRYQTYALLVRRLSDIQRTAVEQLVKQHSLTGVVIEKRFGRSYPFHYHASQIIGFTNADNQGIEGLELAYDRILSPYPGLSQEITYGNTIQLTLDMDIQFLLDQQIVEIDREHYGDYILGIVMEANTGEILAASTFPWYDPNEYGSTTFDQRQNRIVTYQYEPGSVFKIYSLASVLEADQADYDTELFYCDGSYTFTTARGTDVTIGCVSEHGWIDPETMIKKSCNGAIAHWSLQTNDTEFRSVLEKFHFGLAWKIGMPGESSGKLSSITTWSARTKPTISFGQELSVTALQIASAATAIANSGTLLAPSIVKGIYNHDGTIIESSVPRLDSKQIISEQTATAILSYMNSATEVGGTGKLTSVEGISVSSKTGTAQIMNSKTGTYDENMFMASTLSIVPTEKPAYIIYIAVANPKGSTIWGSNIAAPAIAEIIKGLIRQGKLFSSDSETVSL